MKSLLTLLEHLVTECGEICSVDTTMDLKTIHRRFEIHGLRYLTVDLPTFESGLLKSLAMEQVVPSSFSGWKLRQKTPVFLGGFMDMIFDRSTGIILDTASSDAVRCIRQISSVFKKIELECSPSITEAAFRRYVECDYEVKEYNDQIRKGSDYVDRFQRLASVLYSSVFRHVNDDVASFKLQPKHGPGGTADGYVANAKYLFEVWGDRQESVFPFWWYATTRGYSSERYSEVHFLEPETEMPVKVIDVPKTQETPRIIAMEPSYMQYLQQGVAASLMSEVNRSYLYGFISTEHQEPNQLLAHRGSLKQDLATLDLSEASDRVPLALVEKLFEHFPHLLDAVMACRSTTALVPTHGVIPLSKYASMGSALCFPVEIMVFFTICLLGWEDAYDTRFTNIGDILPLLGSVRVYGDDIIVPVDIAVHVTKALETFGFKVNVNKSFWTGKFRESCGKEYFNGDDVSIVRVRKEFPLSRANVPELVSLVSLRNQLYFAGYWGTVAWLDDVVSELIPFPYVSDTSEVLGRHTVLPINGERIGGRYQRPLVKGAVVKHHQRKSHLSGDAALFKCISFREDSEPYGPLNPIQTGADHLQVGGRPDASSINIRWAPSD